MTREAFAALLDRISVLDREFAGLHVHNALPESFRYLVQFNQSHDWEPLWSDQRVFPDDRATFGETTKPLDAAGTVALLWREGFIPEWVDISVERAGAEHTYFSLLCCGRFTSDDSRLYYACAGQGPFGIKSPCVPPRWSESSGRFDLHWHLKP